jgi:hypothetical protein
MSAQLKEFVQSPVQLSREPTYTGGTKRFELLLAGGYAWVQIVEGCGYCRARASETGAGDKPMGNHENRGNPGLTYPEARSVFGVLGDVDPAHFEAYSAAEQAQYDAAIEKLDGLSRGSVMLPFTRKELELLWLAIGNGAGDDAIHNLGLRADERRTLAKAANRIAAAGKLGGPRFSE